MSFTGDLEHLPIVDIVQLLHAARKSGTLLVRGKGESQLVFMDGRVVSTIHRKSAERLNKILRQSKLVAPEALVQTRSALGQDAGLLTELLRQGLLTAEQASTMLEQLLRMSLVEMLCWQQGTFSLDVDAVPLAEEFRLLGEAIGEPLRFDTQGLLMDALRTFDEMQRDGLLDETFAEEEAEPEAGVASVPTPASATALSLEDLGLDGLDRLERKVPDVFSSLSDPTPIDPQRRHFDELAAELAPEQGEELWQSLQTLVDAAARRLPAASGRTLIFYSADALLSHCLATVCKGSGLPIFTTTEAADVAPILTQFLGKGLLPLLIIDVLEDAPGEFSPPRLTELRRQLCDDYPQLPIVEWQSSNTLASSLQAYQHGVRGVFPRPLHSAASFVPDLLLLLEAFLAFVQGAAGNTAEGNLPKLHHSVREILPLKEVQEVADVLLRFVAEFCPRALVLIVAPPGLVAGRSLGIAVEGDEAAPLRLQIPVAETSPLRQVLEEGRAVLASHGDSLLRQHLHPLIGAPAVPAVLLLPLLCRGRKLAMIYGDFGQQPLAPVPLEMLEILVNQAALQIEVALYRKKLEK